MISSPFNNSDGDSTGNENDWELRNLYIFQGKLSWRESQKSQ